MLDGTNVPLNAYTTMTSHDVRLLYMSQHTQALIVIPQDRFATIAETAEQWQCTIGYLNAKAPIM